MTENTAAGDPRRRALTLAARDELLELVDALADSGVTPAVLDEDDLERLVKLARHVADEPASLVARIAAAMAEADRVHKDGFNQQQDYRYASVEAVLAEVRRPLLTRGIILVPTVTDEQVETIRSSRGAEGTALTITITFTFYDGLTDAVLAVPGWKGQGQDYGDKVFGKAYTNAVKTFVRTAWLLPTGDDPEAENPERVARNGQQAPPELPPWARKTSDARKGELGATLIPLVGRERARGIVAAVQGSIGHFPDGFVAFAKLLETELLDRFEEDDARADGLTLLDDLHDRAGELHKAKVAAEVAAQEAAEQADPPAPEPEPDPEPAEEDPDPAEEERVAVAPGTVDVELDTDKLDRAAQLKAYRNAGCICPQPVTDGDGANALDDACPIKGHGIPF